MPARKEFLPAPDLAGGISQGDWEQVLLSFQKRHLLAHQLGVVDAKYLGSSGDTGARLGKLVTLEPEEIAVTARTLLRIYRRFFGLWLS